MSFSRSVQSFRTHFHLKIGIPHAYLLQAGGTIQPKAPLPPEFPHVRFPAAQGMGNPPDPSAIPNRNHTPEKSLSGHASRCLKEF